MKSFDGHTEGVLLTPRALRYLHTLGAIFALLALIVLGLFRISPAGEELLPKAGVFAAMVALLLGYIAYAHRRTAALLKMEAEQSHLEAERATELTVRWRARTYVVFVLVLFGAGAGAALAWSERSWVWLAGCGLVFAWAAKALLARLREPAVLRVGPGGIEDKIKFGLIPWQDIENVFLEEYKLKGTNVANLSVGVRDRGAYLRRVGPVARFWLRLDTLVSSDVIRIPVHTLDVAPLALFRLVRGFHERALPAGAFFGKDNFYQVDLEFGKLKQVMAELERTAARPAPQSGARSARAEDLMARMDALIKADKERISRIRAAGEKTNWVAIIAVVLGLLFALLFGMGVFSR